MIGTISPLVKGERNQWWQSMTLHFAGGAIGGGIFLGALGLIGQYVLAELEPAIRWTVAGMVALVFGLHEFGLVNMPLPKNYHAVPRDWWWDFGPNQAAFAYGLVLGIGITTVVPFGTFYVVAAWAVLAANAEYGLALGATYGLARALPVFAASLAMASQRDRERAFVVGIGITERMGGARNTAHVVNGLADAGFVGLAIAVVWLGV